MFKIEGGKGPLLRSCYYDLEYFETMNIKIMTSVNQKENPAQYNFIRFVKAFHPLPNPETSRPFYVSAHF